MTKEEKLENTRQKIKQLQAQAKYLEKDVKKDERKKRTKRLIDTGAAVEHHWGEIENLDVFNEFLDRFKNAFLACQAEGRILNNDELRAYYAKRQQMQGNDTSNPAGQ